MDMSQMRRYLGGVNYPADKSTIISRARANGAPDDVIQSLQKLPEQMYQTQEDIGAAMG